MGEAKAPEKASAPKGSAKISWTYWLLPIFLGAIGGLIAWSIVRKQDGKIALLLLIVGIPFTFVWAIGYTALIASVAVAPATP